MQLEKNQSLFTCIGFLPGREVFLPYHGRNWGEIPFCPGEMPENREIGGDIKN